MRQKLHTPEAVQVLLNLAMSWAENQLREHGQISAALATTLTGSARSTLLPAEDSARPVGEQETGLRTRAGEGWRRGLFSAVTLVAPVFYGKAGSGERATAVRLHIEARSYCEEQSYCADILMPYRIRPASRWRGTSQNRVHFSHPVAQEAESWLEDSSSGLPAGRRD